MRFKVERTSAWDADEVPCPEAEKGTIKRWDVRTSKSFEEFDATVGRRTGEVWLDRGSHHQVIRGPRGGGTGIRRLMGEDPAFYVTFQSLDELIAFRDRHGDLVLTTASEDSETPCIEIYDGYRE